MRVLVRTVAFSKAALPRSAATVMTILSQFPATNNPATGKYALFHCSQFPRAASENSAGKK